MKHSGANSPIEITDSTLTQFTDLDAGAILLDFWAPWCVPCMLMKRTIDKTASQLGGVATVGLINIEEQPELAELYGIRATPTLLLLNNGRPIAAWTGMSSSNVIRQQVLDALEKV